MAQKLDATCKVKRLQRCQQLLARFPTDRSVRSIWFTITDEKTFTVASPVNSQNDHVYAGASRKRDITAGRLIRQREHFSRSIMISVGVSRIGKTSVVFVDPGAKINSAYYCEVVLGKGLLPDIEAKCGRHKRTLQQDGAPAHTARNTISSTWRKRKSISSSLTCGPQTARILIPSITLSGVPFSSEFIYHGRNLRLWKN